MFQIYDDDGNKKLDYKEFQKGLHDYGVRLSQEEAAAIYKSLDKDNSGSIDFDEFLVAVRVSLDMATLYEKCSHESNHIIHPTQRLISFLSSPPCQLLGKRSFSKRSRYWTKTDLERSI